MLISKIKSPHFFSIVLYHLVFFAILITNFSIGKFFIGWDALNPEFNLSINFQRSFFASWQENYGLGTLTGHGFATQLPHTMIISVLSSLFPMWAVRSVFTFLCLYLGGLGLYFLARLIFYKITVEEYQKKFSTAIEYICLLTALFYILNLATVQMFYLPLEAFIVHFAALPWLFWIIFRLAGKTSRKNLVLFFIINFFASIQGFIPSLFVAYVISLFLFAGIYMVINKFSWVVVKKSLLVIFLTFLINAYWLLPFGYYQISRDGLTQNAYNNLMTTEDFILKNKKYGNLENVALVKGFSFDMQELGGYVFQPWIEHYSQNGIKIIGYGLFVFVLLSAVLSLILIRHVLVKISAVIFLYFLASLATDSPVFYQFTQTMQTISPSYYEAFRTAFTKFALGYSFLFSLFLGLGLYILLGYSYRLLKHKLVSQSVFLGLFSLLIYFTYPVFKGNLLYKKLQVNIPQAYFEVMDFFKNKEDGRIADFPQDCPEGWYGYGWGYFGSGFYWYALKQPVLARTFDVWSNYNENYYWEIIQAVRSHDYAMVDKVMQKYGVKWLLYDPNLIPCRSNRGLLQYDDFINHLESSPKYRLVKSFTSTGILPIKIFEITNLDLTDFVFLTQDLPVVNSYKWNNHDQAYSDYGNYISDNRQQTNDKIYYPFRSLFTGRKQEELEFQVQDQGDYFSFKSKIPKELAGAKLTIPQLNKEEVEEVDENGMPTNTIQIPQVYLDGELISLSMTLPYIREGNLEVRVPKINGLYSYQLSDFGSLLSKTCDEFNKGIYTHERVRPLGSSRSDPDLLRLTSIGSSNCLDFDIPQLSQRLGYLATVENRNIEGKSLLFGITNKNSQRSDMETYLPKNPKSEIRNPKLTKSYFIQPPMEQFGVGYTLHLDNISIGRVKTVNDLGRITVNPIPYRFLTSMKIIKGHPLRTQGVPLQNEAYQVSHPNPSLYQVTLRQDSRQASNNTTLILSQSFDKGWKAYQVTNDWLIDSWYMKLLIPLFGKEIRNHVLVNNWENGWELKPTTNNLQPTTIILVYLPQYLEYIGFGLLLFVPLLFISPHNPHLL